MKKTGLFSLGIADFAKGLIMAVIGAVIGLITATIEAGSLNFDWGAIGKGALLAALAYLTKNFLTSSTGEFLGKEPPNK